MLVPALALVRPLSVQTLAEPYVTAASLRISQQRPDEAAALLQKACDVVGNCDETALPPFDCWKDTGTCTIANTN